MSSVVSEVIVHNGGRKESRRQRNQRANTKTILKTGWHLKAEESLYNEEVENNEPKERWVEAEQKDEGFINDHLMYTLSPEEVLEYEWKKTQRGLNKNIRILAYDDLAVRKVPSSKLYIPFSEYVAVAPIPTEEPFPIYSSDVIPETGMRGKLDLVCMKDKSFLMAFEEDVKERNQKLSSVLRADEKKGVDFLNFRPKGSKFTVSFSDGFKASILKNSQKFSRILCATKLNFEELKQGLVQNYATFKQVQKMDSMDVWQFLCMMKKEDLKQQDLLKKSNIFEVRFGNPIDGQHFCEVIGLNKEFFYAVLSYPEELDEAKDNHFYSMKAHWFHVFSNRRAKIWVKFSEDVGRAEEVLNKHGMDVKIGDKFKSGGSTLLEADWSDRGSLDDYTFHPAVLDRTVRRILWANDIEVDKVVLYAKSSRFFGAKEIIERMNEWNQECVNDPMIEREGYDKYWTVEIHRPTYSHPDSELMERTATITFKDEQVGEKVINSMMYQKCLLTAKDKRGVQFRPVYNVQIVVPKSIRTACKGILDWTDTEIRNNSTYENSRVYSNWARVKDTENEDILEVEGWPKEKVIEVVEKVKSILKPKEIDCSDDDDGENPFAKLLYGCGLALLNELQQQNKGDVLIAVDRLNEKIYIWGHGSKCIKVLNAVQEFLESPEDHLVKTEVRINEPRFLPIFKEVLAFNGEKRISAALGGAKVKFMHPDRLGFEGSVDQYEDLQQLLDEEHTRMVQSASKPLENIEIPSLLSKVCPVCRKAPRGGFTLSFCGHTYCLKCLNQMIRTAIKSKEPVMCCSEGCAKIVALDDIKNLLFDETTKEFKKLFRDRLEPLWNPTNEMTC